MLWNKVKLAQGRRTGRTQWRWVVTCVVGGQALWSPDAPLRSPFKTDCCKDHKWPTASAAVLWVCDSFRPFVPKQHSAVPRQWGSMVGGLKSDYFSPTWDTSGETPQSSTAIWGSSQTTLPPPAPVSRCWLCVAPETFFSRSSSLSFLFCTGGSPDTSLVCQIPCCHLPFKGPKLTQPQEVRLERSLVGGNRVSPADHLGQSIPDRRESP